MNLHHECSYKNVNSEISSELITNRGANTLAFLQLKRISKKRIHFARSGVDGDSYTFIYRMQSDQRYEKGDCALSPAAPHQAALIYTYVLDERSELLPHSDDVQS